MATGFSDGKETQSSSIKKEDGAKLKEEHSHDFNLKLNNSENKTSISCAQPQTILESIRSAGNYVRCIKDDQHVTVQIGKGFKNKAIATHFPCCLLNDGELVTLRASKEEIEEKKEREGVLSKEDYCFFYIEKEPGLNAKKKKLFRSSAIKQFKKLCVYGVKKMTFREALNNDGRFSDHLDDFRLADVKKDKHYINYDQKIDRHHGKTFQICYVHGNECTSKKAARPMKDVPAPKVFSVDEVLRNALMKADGETEQNISKRLKEIDTDIREEMYECFPDNTFQEALKKVDFGKAQQAFSDCYRLEKLLKMGKSVCRLIVSHVKLGTAFVLFKNYVLTNAHLIFNEEKIPLPVTEIYAQFNYLTDLPSTNAFYLRVKKLVDFDTELDYAVLELDVSDQEGKKVPDGLMKLFSPLPKSGEACIIGHPSGKIKKLDIICIIQKEQRVEEVMKHRNRFRNDKVVLSRIDDRLNEVKQTSKHIVMSEEVLSFHTFMYHGASGSPVFDAHCRVVALHTFGFVYDFLEEGHVLEFARSVLSIFARFVAKLKDDHEMDLLKDIEEASKDNEDLLEILNRSQPMDIDLPQNPVGKCVSSVSQDVEMSQFQKCK